MSKKKPKDRIFKAINDSFNDGFIHRDIEQALSYYLEIVRNSIVLSEAIKKRDKEVAKCQVKH